MIDDDDFFDNLEESINETADKPESVAFLEWEKRWIDDVKIEKKFKKGPICWHRKKTLDPDSRMVQCDHCEAYLDPYDVLERFVYDHQRNLHHYNHLCEEVDRLEKKNSALKKEFLSLDGKITRRKKNLRSQ